MIQKLRILLIVLVFFFANFISLLHAGEHVFEDHQEEDICHICLNIEGNNILLLDISSVYFQYFENLQVILSREILSNLFIQSEFQPRAPPYN